MRIFYASNTSPDAGFQSVLWRNNLYLSLVNLGHDVVEFDYDLYETFLNVDPNDPQQKSFIDGNRPKVTEELIRQIRIAHNLKPVDLFFSYFYDACVLPEAIDEIRSLGITTVNWYCNGSYQLHLVSEIAPHYDWCLVPEKFRLEDYVAMGARPIYCQEAANPQIYKHHDLPIAYDVTFIGQAYGDRSLYIQYLRERGIDVQVWGKGWPLIPRPLTAPARPSLWQRVPSIGGRLLTSEGRKSLVSRLMRNKNSEEESPPAPAQPATVVYGGGTLSDDEMIRMYSRSKINLGFSTCGDTHQTNERIMQIRLRDFEVPMSGGFYMVEYMEELEEFFEIGKEIVCYNDREDLADKIKYYLDHDSERETIRWAGHQRCLRDHTWKKRFEAAFTEMGLV
jgi:spore maturation protein CgeB